MTELEAKLLASTTNEKALQARVAELEAMLLAATGPAAASATVWAVLVGLLALAASVF